MCRKCLLSDIDEEAFFINIKQYINSIPAKQKASASEYERRLKICKNCDHLINGMCTLCGCYVEVRAAKLVQHCVESADKW